MTRIMSFVQKVSAKIVLAMMIFISGWALLFSVQSDTLEISSLQPGFVFGLVLVTVVGAVFYTRKNGVRISLSNKTWYKLAGGFFLATFIFQLLVLNNVKPHLMNDALILFNGLKNPASLNWYLSRYPNNTLLYLAMVELYKLVGANIFAFRVVNLILIDVSIALIGVLTKLLFHKNGIAVITAMIYTVFVGIQPLFLFVYTDTVTLPFVMLAAISFLLAQRAKRVPVVIIYSVVSGLLTYLIYTLRPSAIIFVIALFIYQVLWNYKSWRLMLVIFAGFLIGAFSLAAVNGHVVSNQKVVQINTKDTFPMAEWLLLGSFGNENVGSYGKAGDDSSLHGTFNMGDVNLAAETPKKDRSKVLIQAFKNRTKERGLLKTVKFYLVKMADNLDSGVMGYHRDGLWLQPVYSNKSQSGRVLQELVNQDGKYRREFNFGIQIIWIYLLINLFYWLIKGNPSSDWMPLFITIICGLMFLALFESGGTKYMIQYMPFLSIAMAFGVYENITGVRLPLRNTNM